MRTAPETELDARVLSTLYDAGGELPYPELIARMGLNRRRVWAALCRQYSLGNLRRQHRLREPIALTSSARIAIEAGRLVTTERHAA